MMTTWATAARHVKSTGRERYGHAFGEFGKAKAQLKHEAGGLASYSMYGREETVQLARAKRALAKDSV